MVAAGSVITKDVPDYALVAGIPAQVIGGEPIRQLEEKLADYVGVKHCITCANGTDALLLALMAWNVGEGDAVFVPDFTFFSTAEVVPWVKATPIFVDVDIDTFNISADFLEEAVQSVLNEGKLVPKAVIAVDLFGQPADFPKIRKITEKYNLLLLEDGAQGFGGRIGDKKACSFGDIATTSFFPAKPLGCYGDGGAVFTDSDDWAELIQSYKVHGKGKDKYDNVRIGLNSRLDTLQAAILLVKMKNFDLEVKICNQVAVYYNKQLKEFIKIPFVMENMISSWAQYTVQVKNSMVREKLIEELSKDNIPIAVYYKKPLHMQKAFGKEHKVYTICPNSLKLSETVISLPMHAYMEQKDVENVCMKIHERII